MTVFREVTIQWDGTSYTITPTMRLVRAIEAEVSILGTLSRAGSGQPPTSHIAFIVSRLLRSAGASAEDADEDVIYRRLFSDPDLMTDCIAVLSVALGVDPAEAESLAAEGGTGNPPAPAGAGAS